MATTPLSEITDATQFDNSLRFTKAMTNRLIKTYLPSQSYSQKKLYDSMYRGETNVFHNYPLKLNKPAARDKNEFIIHLLKDYLPAKEKINIRTGPMRTLRKVTIADAIDKWVAGRSRFGVTDLHFRKTAFYKKVDAKAISYFNLLPSFPEEVSFLEMLTLVVSSRGIYSDSHSDDGDGSNHCFVGKKLWFAWDREEGRKKGLQDCTYDMVLDKAKFNMKTFLSLKSAHWFLVKENETLFMPGNFSHKVVTLEPYIGFGSFYVSYPNYVRTLKRWILSETSDVTPEFIEIMNTHFMKGMTKLSTASRGEQNEQGLSYCLKALKDSGEGVTGKALKVLQGNKAFKELVSPGY